MGDRTEAYIIAQSLRQANLTATVDWGWRRIGHETFETPSGERVRYLYSIEGLLGMRGAKIYRGHHWFERPERELAMFDHLVSSGYVTVAKPEVLQT